MGSSSSRSDSRERIDPISVPDTEDGYPPPTPPSSRKVDVFRESDYAYIDNHAKSAPASLYNDYDALLEYLFEDIKTDLQKVRAIFSWLGAQNIEEMRLSGEKDPNTPLGYMKLIQRQQGNYTAFFTLLVRKADVPCVVVRGIGKSVGYEVGEEDVSKFRCKWAAVYVGGCWRIVHPLWAFVGVKGHSQGRWTMIDKKGGTQRVKEGTSQGQDVHMCEEFFFLTDPEQFIYFCRANEEPWQLLKAPWTEEKFVESPCVTPEYFTSGLKIAGDQTCKVEAQDGKAVLRFEHPKDKNPNLSYDLFCDEELIEEQLPESTDLDRYVLENTKVNAKSLFLRCPVKGVYKVRVYGGEDRNPSHICDYRVFCDEEAKNPNPYPMQREIGYGYTQEAKDAGLTTTSAYSGIVVLEHGQRMPFEFNLKRPLEFESKLHHRDVNSDDLDKYVEQNIDNKKAAVIVTMPEEHLTKDSEYALEINVREKGDAGFRNVCNYFLTPEKKQWTQVDTDPNVPPKQVKQVKPVRRVVTQKPVKREKPASPVKSPPRSPVKSPPRSPVKSPPRSPVKSPPRSPVKSPPRSPEKSPPRSPVRSPTPTKVIVAAKQDREPTPEPQKDETARIRMREATEGDDIAELEKAIKDFEDEGLDEKDNDLTEAKNKLIRLKANRMVNNEEDKLRRKLIDETDGENIQNLEKALEEAKRAGLEDEGDITRAEQRLLELHQERLQAAAESKDEEKIQKALEEAKQSEVADKLDEKEEFQEAVETKQRIVKLKRSRKKVLELKPPLVSEISSYRRPKPAIHDVMRSTYMLLGEDEEALGNWEYIVHLMRTKGQKSVIRRVEYFDLADVDADSARGADKYISKFDMADVRRASTGAATFYTWSRNIIDETLRDGNNNEQKRGS